MILDFSNGLESMDIHAQGHELARIYGHDTDQEGKRVYTWPNDITQHVHTVRHPVLVSDDYELSKIADSTKRVSLKALYESPLREIRFDGTSQLFDKRKYEGVWSPSIDTILFCEAFRELDLSHVRRSIEVGGGSGFISKYLLEHNPQIAHHDIIDIDPYAEKCWKDTISDGRAHFYTGDAKELLPYQEEYDLVFCNPPYIPRPQSIDDNPYEGLGLIEYFFANKDKILSNNGQLVLNLSSLAGHVVDHHFEDENLDFAKLIEMEVPLKVYNVLNNPEWMNYLCEHGLRKQNHDGYDYWQNLEIYSIQK